MLDLFLNYMQSTRRMSANTCKSYFYAISKFQEFCAACGTSLEMADINDVREWACALSSLDMKPQSINNRISAVGTFYHFAQVFCGWSNNPAQLWRPMKAAKMLPLWISAGTLADILDNKLPRATWKDRRGFSVVLFLYSTGCRCQELCDVRVGDVDFSAESITLHGKGNKERRIPMLGELRNDIAARISENHLSSADPLFTTQDGAKLEPWQVRQILKAAAGPFLPKELCHPHVFRHSCATALINGGADINTIRIFLGHASVTTTQIYTHTAMAPILQTYRKAFPRAL